jgi:tRNA (Thr-GGU) A37 N-methylase
MRYTFEPIGLLHTPYLSKEGVPIQGALDPQSFGTAEVFEEYAAGLQDGLSRLFA